MRKDRKLKRVFETAIAFLLLAVSLPLQAIILLLILIRDGRPVFFKQERVGESGKIFTMWKFRTMEVDCPLILEEIPPEEDDRVTKLGYYLRKFCLDELPQLWNVVRRDLYLVGTRPEVNDPKKTDRYDPKDWEAKLKMPHGISGYWQVYLKGKLPIYNKWSIESEKSYYEKAGFFSDLMLMFFTPVRSLVGFRNIRQPDIASASAESALEAF